MIFNIKILGLAILLLDCMFVLVDCVYTKRKPFFPLLLLQGILSGKHYNRAIGIHKAMYEALYCIMWQSFMKWLQSKDEYQSVYSNLVFDLKAHIETLVSSFTENNNQQEDCVETIEVNYDLGSMGKRETAFKLFWRKAGMQITRFECF